MNAAAVAVGIGVGLALVGVMCGVQFDPEVHKKVVAAFGPTTMGMPIRTVVIGCALLLLIPTPYCFYHFGSLMNRAYLDGKSAPRGAFTMIAFFKSIAQDHPELRNSVAIAAGGVIYLVVIVGVWIAYVG